MAASSYLVKLDERRRQTLSEAIDHLGIASGTVEHEVALSFGVNSLANHDQLDTDERKVERRICSFAEKYVMQGGTDKATRLLLLASTLIGTPLRVDGHRMVGDHSDITSGAAGQPPLEYPHAALALVLALSGSERWKGTKAVAQPEATEEEEEEDWDFRLPAVRKVEAGGRRLPCDGPLGEVGRRFEEGAEERRELADFGGDSSRLWSTDSENDEDSEEREEGQQQHLEERGEGRAGGGGRGGHPPWTPLPPPPSPPLVDAEWPMQAGADAGGTQEWLREFEDDVERSPRTDDEGYATDGSEAARRYGGWGEREGRDRTQVASRPAPSAATGSSGNNPDPLTTVRGFSYRPLTLRHKYGAPCVGASIRSFGGGGDGSGCDAAGSSTAVPPVPSFLRPCQTLEACQAELGAAGRRLSIPEAEVVRAALSMLRGLSGDIFVRVDSPSPLEHSRHDVRPGWMGKDGGGGRTGSEVRRLRQRNASAGSDDGSTRIRDGTGAGRERFSLSAAATSGLAVASLSPEALAGIVGDLVQIGSTAEYLRAFVADAEASTSAAAATVAARRGAQSFGSSGDEGSPKHGHTTQAFVACVARQLEAFEDVVAQRDRWLYLRQQGRGGRGGDGDLGNSTDTPSSSGETIVGLLTLLQPEAESLEILRRLVEAGAGWWIDTPPAGNLAEATEARKRGGGLRERTRRLLAVLHEELVSSALFGIGRRHGVATRRRGWVLGVFCEVLAPYLRLLDSWITEGRVFDPHRELFLSQSGGRDGGGLGGAGDRRHPVGGLDPVVHVWDTGIVLHSKALPPFFAPLAKAIAFAGQDIALVRRVRALAPGLALSTHAAGSRSLASEAFSLAKNLVDSLRRLADRVRRVDDTRKWSGSQDGGEGGGGGRSGGGGGGGGGGRGRGRGSGPSGTPSDIASGTRLGGWDTAGLDLDDVRGGEKSGTLISPHESARYQEDASAAATTAATAADEPSKGGPAPQQGDDGFGAKVEGDGVDVDYSGGGGGGEPGTQPETTAVEHKAARAEGDLGGGGGVVGAGGVGVGDVGGDYAGDEGMTSSAEGGDRKDDDLDLGFFGGTARLAIEPGAMFRRPLHPALADPSFFAPLARETAAVASSRPGTGQNTAPGVGLVSGMSRGGDDGPAYGAGDRDNRGRASAPDEDNRAAAEDAVAGALPPAVVLETCLLRPLREHCRRASSACLRVFVDELGIVSLAGVLRDIYLSPGETKSDTPLSRFRGVLFSLLGATTTPAAQLVHGDDRSKLASAMLDGVVVRDVPAFLKDDQRLTALLRSSLEASGSEAVAGSRTRVVAAIAGERGRGGWRRGESGVWLQASVVGGGDLPLLEHFFVECRPEMVREWRGIHQGQGLCQGQDADQGEGGRRVGGIGSPSLSGAFPLAPGGHCVDLQVFSCLQLKCRLPWPISVALPPRSIDKYSRVLGLLLKLEFANHVLEEAHVLHSNAQRDQPRSTGKLDQRHLQHCRLFAFLRVARAMRSYAVTQALVKPWAVFEARVPLCGSVRGFIALHEAYLDLILERCFLLPRSRQTLAYLLDALQAGLAFSQRYGEYVAQFGRAYDADRRSARAAAANPSNGNKSRRSEGENGEGQGGREFADDGNERGREREACMQSSRKLDELWEALVVALGFVIPLLKELVRSRSGVHVNDLLCDLDFNRFFERQGGLGERGGRSAVASL